MMCLLGLFLPYLIRAKVHSLFLTAHLSPTGISSGCLFSLCSVTLPYTIVLRNVNFVSFLYINTLGFSISIWERSASSWLSKPSQTLVSALCPTSPHHTHCFSLDGLSSFGVCLSPTQCWAIVCPFPHLECFSSLLLSLPSLQDPPQLFLPFFRRPFLTSALFSSFFSKRLYTLIPEFLIWHLLITNNPMCFVISPRGIYILENRSHNLGFLSSPLIDLSQSL